MKSFTWVALPPLDSTYSHAAALTYPPFAVRQLNIPVHRDDIVTPEGKDVTDTDILNIELDFRELVKELSKPPPRRRSFLGKCRLHGSLQGR